MRGQWSLPRALIRRPPTERVHQQLASRTTAVAAAGRPHTVDLDVVVVVQNDQLAQAQVAASGARRYRIRTIDRVGEPWQRSPTTSFGNGPGYAPSQRRGLGADALLQAAVAADDKRVVVNNVEAGLVEHGGEVRLGNGEAHAVREAWDASRSPHRRRYRVSNRRNRRSANRPRRHVAIGRACLGQAGRS